MGQWTEWWKDGFEIDGQALDGYVRMKLVSLSAAGDVFELFVPQVWPATGYTQPEEVAQQIDEHVGNFLQNPGRDALGVVDDATYFELLDFHHQRLADVADYLTESNDWDVLFIETHASDYTSHFFLSQADECSGADPHTLARCQAGVAETYASIDRMIGRIAALANDDTVVAGRLRPRRHPQPAPTGRYRRGAGTGGLFGLCRRREKTNRLAANAVRPTWGWYTSSSISRDGEPTGIVEAQRLRADAARPHRSPPRL